MRMSIDRLAVRFRVDTRTNRQPVGASCSKNLNRKSMSLLYQALSMKRCGFQLGVTTALGGVKFHSGTSSGGSPPKK
jgi:hypothetical protein